MFIATGSSFLYGMTGFLLGYLCGFKRPTPEPPRPAEANDITLPPSYSIEKQ